MSEKANYIEGYRTVENFNLPYYRDAMKHWQRMFDQARVCLREAMDRGAMADNADMLAKWDATLRKELAPKARRGAGALPRARGAVR